MPSYQPMHLCPPDHAFLSFRPVASRYADDIYRLNSNPAVLLYTGEKPWTYQETAGFIRYQQKQKEAGNRRFMVHVNEEVAGMAGFRLFDDGHIPALSFRFFPDFWGQGIATICVMHLTRWGLVTLGFDKIQAQVHPEHDVTQHVLEKCGFTMQEVFSWEDAPWQRWVISA